MKKIILLLLMGKFFLLSCNTSSQDANVETKKAGTRPAYGIDISKWQIHDLKNLQKHRDSLAFVICRSSYGSRLDADFVYNWGQIREKGFIRGAYHYYICEEEPLNQAKFFLSTIGTLSANDFPPIIDFEQSQKDPANCVNIADINELHSKVLRFLEYVETNCRRKPIIYTDLSTGNQLLNDPAFAAYPLWIAYPLAGSRTPKVPKSWETNWSMWQRSDEYKIHGFNENCDFDMFNGDTTELNAFILSH